MERALQAKHCNTDLSTRSIQHPIGATTLRYQGSTSHKGIRCNSCGLNALHVSRFKCCICHNCYSHRVYTTATTATAATVSNCTIMILLRLSARSHITIIHGHHSAPPCTRMNKRNQGELWNDARH